MSFIEPIALSESYEMRGNENGFESAAFLSLESIAEIEAVNDFWAAATSYLAKIGKPEFSADALGISDQDPEMISGGLMEALVEDAHVTAFLQIWLGRSRSAKDIYSVLELVTRLRNIRRQAAAEVLSAIWRQERRDIDVARFILIHYTENLSWIDDTDIIETVQQITECYELFPELEIMTSPAEVAKRIVAYCQCGGGTRERELLGLAIACRVNPTDSRPMEALLRRAGGILDADQVWMILSQHLLLRPNRALITRFLDFVRDLDQPVVAEVLGEIAVREGPIPSLVNSRLGMVAQRCLTRANPDVDINCIDTINVPSPLVLGTLIGNARRRLASGYLAKATVSDLYSQAAGQLNAGLLSSACERLSKLVRNRPLAVDTRTRTFELENRYSGFLSWVDYVVQDADAFIGAAYFRYFYAKPDPDSGHFVANDHSKEVFCFGPYVKLSAGSYELEFLGLGAPGLWIEFQASSAADGALQVLAGASKRLGTEAAETNRMIQLEWFLPEPTPNVEFIIRVKSLQGRLEFIGVRLRRSAL